MYKKILIPTDGSPLSKEAARAGVDFAAYHGAEIIGIFVAPEYVSPLYASMIPPSRVEYEDALRKIGLEYLNDIQDAANAAGLKFFGYIEFSASPAREIVRTAEDNGCELIFMGSHGRSGLGQLVLGSVTTKVLALCQIPVLVYRSKQAAAG
jgi:nucleotide-binding universal stress UspA family protein